MLALVQGITEFLPISSSAHLVLVPVLTEWPDQGLAFDLAVHLGTLVAVVAYFRRDLQRLAADWTGSVLQRRSVGDSRLAWAILWGTVPVGLAGLLLHDFIAEQLRSPQVIAVTTIGFGLLLGAADRYCRGRRGVESIGVRDGLIVGAAQALALVPGTSRSGITITAGLLLGLNDVAAARFSFLLAIPVTALAAGLELVDAATAERAVSWGMLGLGAVLAAVTAFLAIHYFLQWLTRWGMTPYVVYRLLLGGWLVLTFW